MKLFIHFKHNNCKVVSSQVPNIAEEFLIEIGRRSVIPPWRRPPGGTYPLQNMSSGFDDLARIVPKIPNKSQDAGMAVSFPIT